MFQAVYILSPGSPVASVSCALPSPGSLAVGAAAAKPASASAGTLATTKSKAGNQVMCTFCKKMFGKQGIKNHTAKCAEKSGIQGWGKHTHEPESDLDDLDDGHEDFLLDDGLKR